MPAWSGLNDDVFGTPYALLTKPTPPITGLLHVLMQKRGMYGWAEAANGHTPATIAQIAADEPDFTVRGGWDYDTRANDPADVVTVHNPLSDGLRTIGTIAMPPSTPDATAKNCVYDTRLNHGYVADKANNGVTSKALAGAVST